MFKKIICTNHSIQRYEQRTNKTKQNVIKRMIRDIKALRNKKIVKVGNTYYVFYKQPSNNVREFILEQDNNDKDKFYCITVINRQPESSDVVYDKRLKQKERYDKENNNENQN